MEIIAMKIQERDELPECWIHKNKQYFLNSEKLPTISKKYKSVLKDLNIAYNENEESLEYYDKSNYHEEKKELPLYAELPNGTYKAVGKYSNKTPTEKSILAARKLTETVENAVKEFDRKLILEKQTKQIKELMQDKYAAGFYAAEEDPIQNEFIIEGEEFRIFPAVVKSKGRNGEIREHNTYYYAIFNMSKIQENAEIDLVVPSGQEKHFIGRKGRQVKEWREKLKLKNINVTGI